MILIISTSVACPTCSSTLDRLIRDYNRECALSMASSNCSDTLGKIILRFKMILVDFLK